MLITKESPITEAFKETLQNRDSERNLEITAFTYQSISGKSSIQMHLIERIKAIDSKQSKAELMFTVRQLANQVFA